MTRLLMLVGAEIGVVVVTARLSADARGALVDPELWRGDPAPAMVALVLVLAWAASWWILLGTVHDVILTVGAPRRRAAGASRRLAPAWVQRIVAQAVGAGMLLSTVAGPAAAMVAPDVGQVITAEVVAPPADARVPVPRAVLVAEPGVVLPQDAGPVRPESEGRGQHVVAQGENLWTIARRTLEYSGSDVDDRQVHAYWVRLIQQNEVDSGDPDLVFPGEVLTLPGTAT